MKSFGGSNVSQPDRVESVVPHLSAALYWLWAVLWLSTIASSAVIGWPVSLRFETNDDFWMFQIASGRYTGTPSEFLLYMHVGVGLLLKTLFSHFPGLNWYVLLLLGLHGAFALSVIWIGRRLASQTYGWMQLACAAVLFHGFVYFRLQFTTSAFVGAAAAVLLLLNVSADESARGKKRMTVVGLALALWAVAYMVRREAAVLAVVLALPAVLYSAVKYRAYPMLGAAAVCAGVLMGALGLWESLHMAGHPEWKAFMHFNRARGRIHVAPGYGYDRESAALYSRLGWSENDVQMFQQWFFADPRVHAPEKIEYIASALRRPMSAGQAVKAWWRTLSERRFYVVSALFWAVGFLVACPSLAWPWGLTALLSIGLQIYLRATARLPPRVLMPMLFALPIFFLTAVVWCRRYSRRTGTGLKLWMLAAAVLLLWSVRPYGYLRRTHREMAAAWQEIRDQERISGARVLVLWADDWPVEWAPVSLKMPDRAPVSYISLSSLTQSPHHWAAMERCGLRDLVEDMVEHADVMLACRRKRLPYLERYVWEHHLRRIRAQDRGGWFGRRVFKLRPAATQEVGDA